MVLIYNLKSETSVSGTILYMKWSAWSSKNAKLLISGVIILDSKYFALTFKFWMCSMKTCFISRTNKIVDIKFSAHDAFLE